MESSHQHTTSSADMFISVALILKLLTSLEELEDQLVRLSTHIVHRASGATTPVADAPNEGVTEHEQSKKPRCQHTAMR